MTRRRDDQRADALDILEQAVSLLRSAGTSLFTYYAGALPFVLGLLYFWADMSRSGFAVRHCAAASLGLAFLFIWMKVWQSVFAARLFAGLAPRPPDGLTPGRLAGIAAGQALVQPAGLIVLPLAAAAMIPFAWAFAFYQNATVLDRGDDRPVTDLCRDSLDQTKLWPRQNHIILFILSIAACFVFLNIGATLLTLPFMLKRFLGIESIYAMSGASLLNTTFLAATAGLTYLCVDPLVKAAYVLRCFHGRARATGEDLRAKLDAVRAPAQRAARMAAVVILAGGCLGGAPSDAAAVPPAARTSAAVSADALNRSLDETIRRPEFTWRMPREKPEEADQAPEGLLSRVIDWIFSGVESAVKTVGGWIRNAFEWLDRHMFKRPPGPDRDAMDWTPVLRILLAILLAALVGVLCLLMWQSWRRRRKRPAPEAAAPPPPPDPLDEDAPADALPSEEWRALAAELLDRGDMRPAVRALYLAVLARLGEAGLIAIARHKSNAEYAAELSRRGGRIDGLRDLFASLVQAFDRFWYGMHPADRRDVERFDAAYDRIVRIFRGDPPSRPAAGRTG